jgi:hypothetical protein
MAKHYNFIHQQNGNEAEEQRMPWLYKSVKRCALLQSVLMSRLSRIFLPQVFLLINIASIGQQKTRADIDSVVNNIEISLKSYERVHMRSRKIDKLEDYQYFIDTTPQKLGKVLSYPNKNGVSRTFYFSNDKLLKAIVVKYVSKTERRVANLFFSNKREIYRSDPAHILPNTQQLLKEAREISEMLNIIRTRK